jgi:hypothetical protein
MVQNNFKGQMVMARCAVRGGRPQDRKTTGKRPVLQNRRVLNLIWAKNLGE